MKISILADSHWGLGENQLFLDYFSKFHREVFFPYLADHNIKTVIHLGDLVHRRKHLNFLVSSVLRKEYIQPSIDMGLDTHIIAGNHDTFFKNTNDVNALRETVMGKEGFHVYSNPTIVNFGKLKTMMMPWICEENSEQTFDMAAATDATVVFAHLELVGFEMARGQMMDHGMDPILFKKFDAVYSGHYHHKNSKGNIHYMGAPYEHTWADCDDPKGFHVLDTDTLELEFIRNPHIMFQKVHYNGETKSETITGQIVKVIVHDRTNQKKLDKFVSMLEKNTVECQVLDEHLHVDEKGAGIVVEDVEDTLKIVNDVVWASDVDVDKDALCRILKELYVEAQIHV